ncbi:MAG: stage III sporulation protein AC [Firmicutes bacterium]|nr:stage III sporulation protein AC [Bacillota bacterium]
MSDTSVVFFLAGLALIVTILHTFLKQAGRDEYAYLTLMAGLAIGLIKLIPLLSELYSGVRSVFNIF